MLKKKKQELLNNGTPQEVVKVELDFLTELLEKKLTPVGSRKRKHLSADEIAQRNQRQWEKNLEKMKPKDREAELERYNAQLRKKAQYDELTDIFQHHQGANQNGVNV